MKKYSHKKPIDPLGILFDHFLILRSKYFIHKYINVIKILGGNRKSTKYHKNNLKYENIEIYLKKYSKIEKS